MRKGSFSGSPLLFLLLCLSLSCDIIKPYKFGFAALSSGGGQRRFLLGLSSCLTAITMQYAANTISIDGVQISDVSVNNANPANPLAVASVM